MIPTADQIIERIKDRKKGDMLGFEWQEYCPYLNYEQLVRAGVEFKEDLSDTDKKAINDVTVLDRDKIIEQMRDYMPFAVGKAENQRGISASRSLSHYVAWIWLAGDFDFSKEIDENHNSAGDGDYGLWILEKICEKYGFSKTEEKAVG